MEHNLIPVWGRIYITICEVLYLTIYTTDYSLAQREADGIEFTIPDEDLLETIDNRRYRTDEFN